MVIRAAGEEANVMGVGEVVVVLALADSRNLTAFVP